MGSVTSSQQNCGNVIGASGWQCVTTDTKHLIKMCVWNLMMRTAHFYALLVGLNCNPRVGTGLHQVLRYRTFHAGTLMACAVC